MSPAVLDQVCTTAEILAPLLYADLLQIAQVLGLLLGNAEFQLSLKSFRGWRPTKPLQDLGMLFTGKRHHDYSEKL